MLVRPAAGWDALILRAAGVGAADAPWAATVARYLDEVLEWNRRTDLTAARTAEELVDLTLADAVAMARASPAEGAWVDVGTGAGAPGLILAMLLPGARFTLVEPKDRRVAFLRSAIGKFELKNAVVERGRSDRLAESRWDIAVSRATLAPPEWLREGLRLARRTWVLLAREEAPAANSVTLEEDLRYEWPLTQVLRRAVRYARE